MEWSESRCVGPVQGIGGEAGVKNYLNAFVVLMTAIALALGVFGYVFSERLLNLLGTPAGMLGDAKVYLKINFLGILFLFGYNFWVFVFRFVFSWNHATKEHAFPYMDVVTCQLVVVEFQFDAMHERFWLPVKE